MIRFSQCLQEILTSEGWTRVRFAKDVRVSPANVSRWVNYKTLPDREVLGRIIAAVPEDRAPGLITAWIGDSLPKNADRMVGIVPKVPTAKVKEPTADEWPSQINRATRRKFIDFSKIAAEHPDVMEIVDVLHAAAMRAAAKGGAGK
ncbi:MAG: helix-turn-helix transcriptional regulator [Armatimonadetes bacterium]|nr:helix-turn-helix transcriptional regulator [Akkermansiaceae bacterium]